LDKITKIEAKNNIVQGIDKSYTFDFLFIAMGMGKVKTKGLEHTHSICGKPEESVVIKDLLGNLLTKGKGNINVGFGGNPKDLTATVVRGGPAFELLFNISVLLKEKKLRENFNLTFFAPMDELGKRMGAKAYDKMDSFFKHYKVKTHFGKKIKEFTETGIEFEDDTQIPSDLTLFISSGDGHPIIKESDLPQNEAGFIQINEMCRVEGFPRIYAIGDIAAIIGHKWAAKQGHVAEVMADVAVFNFHNEQSGKEKRMSYWERLHIICVMDSGEGAAFVMRTAKTDFMVPLPIIGHWLKKGWGWYYKNSKKKRMFRISGM
jgi:sulfide:quinone oxidoreductase